MTIKAKAKINIGLNVIRKRDDGYHDLETFFYPLANLYDIIEIEKSDKFTIDVNPPIDLPTKDNLIFRAVKHLEKITGEKINVKIKLKKNIPIGGGLGGGSSDAAATLKAVNLLFKLNLPTKELKKIALLLGSDVPFFIEEKPAFGFSRGEVLEYFSLSVDYPILLVNPQIHISTSETFSKIKPGPAPISIKEILQQYPAPSDWRGKIKNDFEEVIFPRYPLLQKIKENLYESGAVFALMSGTGSTLYGIFESRNDALKAKEIFSENFFVKIV